MQSILISSKDRKRREGELEKIFREFNIDKFDRTIFEFEKAVGIPDIRELQKRIYLKPFKSLLKAIVIDATPGITTEAQNALLKTLEETPEDTIIIMLVPNADELLPTILSRCKLIELSNSVQNSQITSIPQIPERVGEKLKLAQDLSKDLPAQSGKNQSLDFLEDLILFARKDLVNNYKLVKSAQKFHTIIKTTNVNLRLALENLFLNL